MRQNNLRLQEQPRDSNLSFHILSEGDFESCFRLRLEALESEPMAFGSSPDDFCRNREQLRDRLSASNSDNFILGAFLQGEMVGMIGYFRFAEQKLRHKGRVWGLFVQSIYRGAGIGGALLRELLRLASLEQGMEQIILAVNPAQTVARHLYERLGFKAYGHETNALKIGQIYVSEDLMMLRLER